ncbi:MAG: hypothetical protein LBU87_00320 [Lactobacillales bacterium]|jgi:BirA family biotin operon repressor/biotin-[acetyl-CoA-carboxylase] ligase|nr:hypothetical protein [Lactobacillales bacterium]
MQKAAGIGEKITVNLPRKQCHGIFKSLDLSGALVLETPGGVIEKIAAGDIFFTHE